MSVDRSIDELTRVLEQVERLARNLDYGAYQLLKRLNQTLNNFDAKVAEIADSSQGVTKALQHSANSLPEHWTYMALAMSFVVVALVIVVFLGLKSMSTMRQEITEIKRKSKKQKQRELPPRDYDYEDNSIPLKSNGAEVFDEYDVRARLPAVNTTNVHHSDV